MNRRQELSRQLGEKYRYERFLSHSALRQLQAHPPKDFSQAVAARLAVGCVRLDAVLYRSHSSLLLGYDVFVKDDPDTEEWLFFDSLPDKVSLNENVMLRILDAFVSAQGLSFTACCFAALEGKEISKRE